MKHIVAFIKEHKLTQVTHALHGVDGLTGMTASSVRGFGRTRRGAGDPSITDQLELLTPRIRIDVFCSDDRVETVVEAIRDAAHTGLRGDGKVYMQSVDDAIRIETGERGEGAL
jgi:nitrogen regulatory protein P-II 1